MQIVQIISVERTFAGVFISTVPVHLRLRKNDEVLADPGYVTLVIIGQRVTFQLCLFKDMLKSIFLLKNKSYKTFEALGEAFRAKVCQQSTFWRARFLEKIRINRK